MKLVHLMVTRSMPSASHKIINQSENACKGKHHVLVFNLDNNFSLLCGKAYSKPIHQSL